MQYTKPNLSVCHLLGSSTQKISQICASQQCLIYLCGCFLIFYSPYIDQQISYIKHRNAQISCIAATADGKYIAVAEQGKMPSITVYNIQQIDQKKPEIQWELKGHKNGVDMIAFSPNGKYLVSLSNKDGSMFIWEKGQRISKNKIGKPVNKIIFDQSGDLISIGRGQFKVWKFEKGQVILRQQQDCWMIQGRTMTFGKKFSTKDFIDMACYNRKILALSLDGMLCIISKQLEKVEKWIDLMMTRSSSIEVYDQLALVSGQNSIVKAINLETLTLQAKFPKPPPNLKQNIAKDELLQYHQNASFPKCTGVKKMNQLVITLYENRTIFVWKIQQDIRALRSVISHQKTITSLCLLEEIKGDISFFGTTSQDGTIRVWHFYKKYYENQKRESIDLAQLIGIKRNVYCRNLTRIIYTDSQKSILKMKLLGDHSNQKQKSIVCISFEQFMMYSLQNFQLVAHDYFDSKEKALSLQTKRSEVIIGFESGLITFYKVTDFLQKIRSINFDFPIQQLTIGNLCSLQNKNAQGNISSESTFLTVFGKRSLLLYDIKDDEVTHEFKKVNAMAQSQKFIIYCSDQVIHIYNIKHMQNKNIKPQKQSKFVATISFAHEVQIHQFARVVKSNQWLIVVLTTASRLVIANFSGVIIHTQKINERINDFQITQNGQLIIVSQQGTISILKVDTGNKYQRVQNKVKKWFEQNDMSWMDGSVWRSGNMKLKNDGKNEESSTDKPKSKQDIVIPLTNSDSLTLGDQSVGFPSVQLPDININYKNQGNKMSVFNPSSIVDQVNKIYKNVNQKIRNDTKNSAINSKSPRFDQSSIEQIKGSNLAGTKRRKIFGQNQQNSKQKPTNANKKQSQKNSLKIPPMIGNLVQSTYHQQQDIEKEVCQQDTFHPYISNQVDTEQSIDSGYIEMQKVQSDQNSNFRKKASNNLSQFYQNIPNRLSQDQFNQNLKQQSNNAYETILDEMQMRIDSKQFRTANRDRLHRIYLKLHQNFYQGQKKQKEQIKKKLANFMKEFDYFLNQQ